MSANAKNGSGELKLSKKTMTTFLMYMYGSSNPKYSDGANKKNNPMLMTISKDGKSSHYYYCPYVQGCETGNYVFKSIKKCEKRSNGSPCFVFAKGRVIVWDDTNIRIPRRVTVEEIRKIFKENGWY